MFELQVISREGLAGVRLSGRVDAQSAPEVQSRLLELIFKGERQLLVDLEAVDFLSSAGLRSLLLAHRELRQAGGELVLLKPAPNPREVLRLSGFLKLLRVVEDPAELGPLKPVKPAGDTVAETETGGIRWRCLCRPGPRERLVTVGSPDKLASADYSREDVVSVTPDRFRHGAGLASLGERFEDYRRLFGESVVLGGRFFTSPAVPRPSVDFMLREQLAAGSAFKFLYGFGFGGPGHWLASFERPDGPIVLDELAEACLEASGFSLAGLVMLAESRGLWPMNLKKVPLREHRPGGAASIFDPDRLAEWFNFPVEPGDFNQVVAAAGLLVRDASEAGPAVRRLLPEQARHHVHAAVFRRAPLDRRPEAFEAELQRVTETFEVLRVQHLLGESRFGAGLACLVELEE